MFAPLALFEPLKGPASYLSAMRFVLFKVPSRRVREAHALARIRPQGRTRKTLHVAPRGMPEVECIRHTLPRVLSLLCNLMGAHVDYCARCDTFTAIILYLAISMSGIYL